TSVVASPSTLMMSVLCMLVLIAVAAAITIGDISVFGLGLWAVVISAVSVGSFWLASGYGGRSPWHLSDQQDLQHPDRDRKKERAQHSLHAAVFKATIAGSLIFAAGYTLSQTGDAL